MSKTSFGLDPEVFVKDTTSGKIISSLLAVKQDKHNPVALAKGVKLYADNALLELAMPPTYSVKDCVASIGNAFRLMQKHLGNKFMIEAQASHEFTRAELADPSLWEAGCNPSYNAYTGLPNPKAEFTDGTRTGSFHIHIGHKGLSAIQDKMSMIRLLDIYLGMASVIFDKDETSAARRKLYGRAGEFRPTDYGLEYRVLGNWALRSPKTTELVFDIVNAALDVMERGQLNNILSAVNPVGVQMCINECDYHMAVDLMGKVGMHYKLWERINAEYKPDFYRDWKLISA